MASGRTGAVTNTHRASGNPRRWRPATGARRQRRRAKAGNPSDLSGPRPDRHGGQRTGSGQPQRGWHGHRHGDAEHRTRRASKAANGQREADPARPGRSKASRSRSRPEARHDHSAGKRPPRRPNAPAARASGQRRTDQPTPPGRGQHRASARHHQRTTRKSHDTPPQRQPATEGSPTTRRRGSGGRPAGSGPQGREGTQPTPPAPGPEGAPRQGPRRGGDDTARAQARQMPPGPARGANEESAKARDGGGTGAAPPIKTGILWFGCCSNVLGVCAMDGATPAMKGRGSETGVRVGSAPPSRDASRFSER